MARRALMRWLCRARFYLWGWSVALATPRLFNSMQEFSTWVLVALQNLLMYQPGNAQGKWISTALIEAAEAGGEGLRRGPLAGIRSDVLAEVWSVAPRSAPSKPVANQRGLCTAPSLCTGPT